MLLIPLVAAESFLTLAWVRLLLRISPRRALRGTLAEHGEDLRSHPASVIRVFRHVASRTPFAHNCLHRSLALQRMLLRRGVDARLRIGIGRKPALFPGHAWLEVEGLVVNDDPAHVSRYTPLNITESALEASYQ